MHSASKSLASKFAFIVAKRLASVLLPIGFGAGDFIGAAKAAFVEAAGEQIKKRGDRPSAARIAIVTGLSRAEVAKIRLQHELSPKPFSTQRTERVMHGWFSDSRYVDAAGNPRPLVMTGQGSFEELVKEYSGDIPRRAVLEELIAGGMAEVDHAGTVRAIRRHYLLASGQPATDLESLAADIDVLFRGASQGAEGVAVRRISVQFADGIPLAVKRTVKLRTERFLEALSDYLHASASAPRQDRHSQEASGPIFKIMVTEVQSDDHE